MDDSSDEDIDYGRQQVLPVADFDTYDPATAPTTGEEYLRRVQLEAAACPKVVVAPINVDASSSNQTTSTTLLPPGQEFIGTEKMPDELQQKLVADFSKVRETVEEKRQKLTDEEKNRLRTYHPKTNRKSYWKRFTLGHDVSSDSDDDTQNRNRHPPKDTNPPLKLLLSLDQSEIFDLLELNSKWMKEYGFSATSNGVWIYSLLSVLEKPLPSDAYAILRDLSRAISHSRANDDPDETSLTQMNILILLIGRYFEQTDLLDK